MVSECFLLALIVTFFPTFQIVLVYDKIIKSVLDVYCVPSTLLSDNCFQRARNFMWEKGRQMQMKHLLITIITFLSHCLGRCCMLLCECEGQRTICGSWFSPALWVLGIESGMAASVFTYWPILPAHMYFNLNIKWNRETSVQVHTWKPSRWKFETEG